MVLWRKFYMSPDIIEQYIKESFADTSNTSTRKIRNVLIKFFNLAEDVPFDALSKNNFIDIFSSLALMSKNSFYNRKGEVNDFLKWMIIKGYGSNKILDDFSTIQFSDIDRTPFYDKYYFRDIEDLYDTMEDLFSDRGSEFDTFRVAAILVWVGIELKDIPNILKTDLDEHSNTIKHPVSKQVIHLPERPRQIIYFLAQYRDSDTYDTKKFGGGTLSYKKSSYLLRSYKSSHFTLPLLSNISTSANRESVSKGFYKEFQWNRIYFSGIYYRINQYEQINGIIGKNNISVLKHFFNAPDQPSIAQRKDLIRKYEEYMEFKNYMYS